MVFDPWNTQASEQAKKDAARQAEETNWRDRGRVDAALAAARASGDPAAIQAAEAKKADVYQQINDLQMASKGLNPDGSPKAPDWHSLIDPTTGQLQSQYQMNLQGLDPTQWQGYQQLKQESLRAPGQQSQWAQLQGQKQTMEEQQARDAAAKQALTANAQAGAGLAMRGGYGSGARSLLALNSQRDLLNAGQNVGAQGAQARLGIASTDEQNRLAGLQNLAASEADIGKYNKTFQGQQSQFNLNNLLNDIQGRRMQEMGQYSEQMKKWAAGKQADATMASSGGGGGK